MRKDALSDTRTLSKLKKLIAKLDNIISIAIHDELINVEGDIKDELSSN